jgi:membrane protease YdiL (CAAX protease family)
MVSSQVAVALGLSEEGTLPLLRRAFAHLSPAMFVLAVLIVGVGAGVGEELFFRGYLLTRLEERVRGWLAIAAVAFVFGLAHFDPVHSTFAFLIGLAQGWTARRSGSIRPAIVAHVVNNVIGVVGMSLGGDTPDTWSPLELGGGFALALAGLVGVWFATRDRAD